MRPLVRSISYFRLTESDRRLPTVFTSGQTVPSGERAPPEFNNLGGLARVRERNAMLSTLAQDLRFALRQFRRTPGFTIAAVAVLALGLGANTAIFSVVNALLLRPLPYAEPDRLVAMFERNIAASDGGFNSVSPGAYYDWKEPPREELRDRGRVRGGAVHVAGAPEGAAPQKVQGAVATRELFLALRVSPVMGRIYTDKEDLPGADRVVLIGHALWQQRFGGDPGIVGRQARVDNVPSRIVGVMPKGFAFPSAIRKCGCRWERC